MSGRRYRCEQISSERDGLLGSKEEGLLNAIFSSE
jgi:hypothetical protein